MPIHFSIFTRGLDVNRCKCLVTIYTKLVQTTLLLIKKHFHSYCQSNLKKNNSAVSHLICLIIMICTFFYLLFVNKDGDMEMKSLQDRLKQTDLKLAEQRNNLQAVKQELKMAQKVKNMHCR